MSSSSSRTPKTGGRSVFFQDLASPISTNRGKFTTPGQAAAVSALWRENFGGTDPPPPPFFTLEDRVDLSPQSGISVYPFSSDVKSEMRPTVKDYRWDSPSPLKSKFEGSPSYPVMGGQHQQQQQQQQQMQQSPSSSNWWSPRKSDNEHDEKGKGSPVDGVVQKTGALLTLPPPREVARPELPRNSLPAGNLDEEEWVTVYGFSPSETNFVLHEFEKCGVILKHVPGPGNANWMHLLYQNRSDAKKALSKSGMEINGILIVGVKPLDPIQRQTLNEGLNNQGFMRFPPPSSSRNMELIPSRASSQPQHLPNIHSTQRSVGVIATPAKSMVSKIADLMFGI